MLDALTDAMYPVIDRLEERIDDLEARVLERVDRRQLGEIYRTKQHVQAVLRPMVSQRDQFAATTSAIHDLPGLTRGSREYLRDVGDHLAQVTGELHRQTDDLNALTSTYFNANTNRLNLTVTRLTVIATFFLIWTLITSFFGQNFGWLVDHISTPVAFVGYGLGGLLIPTVVAAVLLLAAQRTSGDDQYPARMSTASRERLAPEVFRLPVERIRTGYYSDAYFNYTKALLEAEGRRPHVVMQVFQRKESVLGGIDEAIAVLKAGARAAGARTAAGRTAGTPSRCTRSTRATSSRRGRP